MVVTDCFVAPLRGAPRNDRTFKVTFVPAVLQVNLLNLSLRVPRSGTKQPHFRSTIKLNCPVIARLAKPTEATPLSLHNQAYL